MEVTEDIAEPVANSTMRSLFSFSSRLLASLRAYDRKMDRSVLMAFGGSMELDDFGDRMAPPPPFTPLPGPWRFITSGYALVLLAMAILLNRIQNIVVPPRHPLATRLARSLRTQSTSRLRRIYDSILPLDLSSTSSRLALRLPSLYFLCQALVLWAVILMQTAELFPSRAWATELGKWAAKMEMERVCWSTFCAVCGALCTDALTRGLEGAGTSANSSPFNLFGYAFILHIYSWPTTHVTQLPGMAARPDKHIVFTLIMPLLQLTMIHFLGIRQRWSQRRLVPTTITSTLSLIHFYALLWISPASYPLLNYLPCIFETGLIALIVVALSLNALTQILLEGSVTRPLFGHPETLLPEWDEDFSIVLLRIGTASLEATSVAGLGNEVGVVSVPDFVDQQKSHTEYGSVELNWLGVTSMTNTVEGVGRRQKTKKGFANEIKNVKAKAASSDGELGIDATWSKELKRFGGSLISVLKGLWTLVWDRVRRRARRSSYTISAQREGTITPETSPSDGTDDADESDAYDQFLRGQPVSDDENDYEPVRRSRTGSLSGTSSSTSDDEGDDDEAETIGLYADLSSTATSTSTSAPVLLAHMVDTSVSPLTRRRYSRLVGGAREHSSAASALDDWSRVIDDRRSSLPRDRNREESPRICVICTVEPRQIICWPCRCLALCDDCRESLVTRSAANKHNCPCCRTIVEGYSKIYIP